MADALTEAVAAAAKDAEAAGGVEPREEEIVVI